MSATKPNPMNSEPIISLMGILEISLFHITHRKESYKEVMSVTTNGALLMRMSSAQLNGNNMQGQLHWSLK